MRRRQPPEDKRPLPEGKSLRAGGREARRQPAEAQAAGEARRLRTARGSAFRCHRPLEKIRR